MRLDYLDHEIMLPNVLAAYKVPLGKETGANFDTGNTETVKGKSTSPMLTKAQLLGIEEHTCPVRHKAFYLWRWRACKHENYDCMDAEGNLFIWETLTDTHYREGSTLKPFLDRMTERDYSLGDWKAVGLSTLIGKQFFIIVKQGFFDIVADGPQDILGDARRLQEYGYRVTAVEMLGYHAAQFAEQVAAATAPPPAPAQIEEQATAELDMTTLPVAPAAAGTSANKADGW